ncbi:MAG: hypothetical protein ACXACG_13705 [Candidatus Thorarchaeota archaeon]
MTRKYCTGCGASLLKKVEDLEPEPVEEPEEVPVVETPSFSEDEPLVRPSEVASEQVEMESVVPKTYEEIEEAPLSEDVSIEPEVAADVPESAPMEYDRGKEVVKDILEKVKAAEARTRGEEVSTPSETEVEPPPEETFEEIDEPIAYEEPVVESEIEEPPADEIEPAPQEEMLLEEPTPFAPIPEAPPSVSMTVDEPARDEKVRGFESDIKTFNIEREQLQSELESLRTRLDEEVDRYLTIAGTKRSRAEGLERELSLAKKEYNDANKEYKNAENNRKRRLSSAKKLIRDAEKRIKKAEDSRDKRIRDLEKERRKREEEAKKA